MEAIEKWERGISPETIGASSARHTQITSYMNTLKTCEQVAAYVGEQVALRRDSGTRGLVPMVDRLAAKGGDGGLNGWGLKKVTLEQAWRVISSQRRAMYALWSEQSLHITMTTTKNRTCWQTYFGSSRRL